MAITSLLLALAALVPRPPEPVLDDIGAELRSQCSAGRFSGTVIVLQGNKKLLDIRCQPPGSPQIMADTRFKLFSMSKMFTGAAIARLIERDQVDPNAKISLYLKHLPSSWREVRVSHLLTHTSGIPDLTNDLLAEFKKGKTTHQVVIDRVLADAERNNPPLASEPGTKFAYNNFGYELLARVGQAATGKPFDRVLEQLVLRPAGMRDTVVAKPRLVKGRLDGSQAVARLVQGYNGTAGKLEPAESYSFVQLGAGAVIGTASDLESWSHALKTGAVLSPALQARMASEAFKVSETVAYGYGLMYRKSGGCTVLQHSGGTNGFNNDFAYLPQRDATVLVLSNFGFFEAEKLRKRLVDSITAARPCASAPAS